MRLSPIMAAASVVVLAACASGKPSSGGSTTAKAGEGSGGTAGISTSTTTVATAKTTEVSGTTTTNPLLQRFVYRPDGFCQAFSNYITYGTIVSRLAVGSDTSSSTSTSAGDAAAREGATTLVFAPALAPTTQVLQGDAPEELLVLFKDFDVYNDEAVTAVGALGVDTDQLGRQVATQLAAVDPTSPAGDLPDADSVAQNAGIDRARLDAAGRDFVASKGSLQNLFAKYGDIATPSADRQKELIDRYPCLQSAFATG